VNLMLKKLIFLLLIIQYCHPTTLLMNNQEEEIQENKIFDLDIVMMDNNTNQEEDFCDDWGLDEMRDDFLVAGDPYPPIYLVGLKVGSFLLYCCYQVEKGIRFSLNKTMRILRVKK